MVRQAKRVDIPAIVPLQEESLLERACPDLADWPKRWQYDTEDLGPGAAIVAIFKPFLLHLLRCNVSKTTFNRHRNNLWQLGGETIRRRHEDPSLEKLPLDALIRQLIEPDGGLLIWPRITETEQNALDATCRQLYRFLHN